VFLGFLVPSPFYFAHKSFPRLVSCSAFSHNIVTDGTTHGLNNLNAALICWYLGYICVGINSSIPIYFVLGFV